MDVYLKKEESIIPRVSDNYIEKRKKQIVEAAAIVFSKKGFTETTMKDVIEEAGISRGGLYAHFNNIEELFLEVLKEDDILNEQSLITLSLKNSSAANLKEWILGLVKALELSGRNLTRAKSEYLMRFINIEVPYLKERREKLQKVLLIFISEGISKEEFREDIDTLCFIDILISSIDGFMISELENKSNQNDKIKKLDILADLLINYLV